MPERSNLLYARGGTQMPPTLDGLPLLKPPYGRVTAIDLNKGDIEVDGSRRRRPAQPSAAQGPEPAAAWRADSQCAAGDQEPVVRRDGRRAIWAADATCRSAAGRSAPACTTEPTKLRAYDKATGAPLWECMPPARPLASPMTYMHQGKQYLVVAAGSGARRRTDRVFIGVLEVLRS